MRMIVIGTALLLTACGGSDEGREVASGSFDAGDGEKGEYSMRGDGENATFRIKTEDGESVIRTGDRAGGMPGGLPLYPRAKVVTNATMSGDGTQGGMTILEIRDTPEKVAAFYRAAADRAGWKIEAESRYSGGITLGGTTTSGAQFGVIVTPGDDPGSSGVMITMGSQ